MVSTMAQLQDITLTSIKTRYPCRISGALHDMLVLRPITPEGCRQCSVQADHAQRVVQHHMALDTLQVSS